MAKMTNKELQERIKNAAEERSKKATESIRSFTADITNRRANIEKENQEDAAKRKSLGQMTREEQNKWDKMSKQEKRVIEDRLAAERDRRPNLFEAKAREKKEAYQAGTLKPEQKAEYEQALNIQKQQQSFVDWMKQNNPHLDINDRGQIINKEQGFLESKPGYHINMPTMTMPQVQHANQSLQQAGQYMPGFLEGLSQQYSSPQNTQLESMFGHMGNPILQSIMNSGPSSGSQVLFPSQIAEQSGGYSLQDIFGQLLQQGLPQILSGLGNKLNPNQNF